jgi:2-hydroxychromene-2-carboxylate isomerase
LTEGAVEEFTVYADFNCPFCCALNERLADLNGSYHFEWRPIQHMPSIDGALLAPATQAQLASEVFTVGHRAPEVTITLSHICSISRRATELYVAAMAIDAERGADLRRDIYRALWVEGLDIADPDVLAELIRTHGFEDLGADLDTRLALGEWPRQWEHGPFDERIPVISNDQGRTLLGLASPNEIKAFLGDDEFSLDVGGVCDFAPRQSVMLVGRLVEFWPFVAALDDHCDIQVMIDGDEAIGMIENDIPPDLVLIEGATRTSMLWTSANESWARLRAATFRPSSSTRNVMPSAKKPPSDSGPPTISSWRRIATSSPTGPVASYD